MNTCENCNYWKPITRYFGECIRLQSTLRPVIPITDDMENIGLHYGSGLCIFIKSPPEFGCIYFSPLIVGKEFWRDTVRGKGYLGGEG